MRAGGYQPRSSEGSVLHGLVRDHLETFLQAAIAGRGGVVAVIFKRPWHFTQTTEPEVAPGRQADVLHRPQRSPGGNGPLPPDDGGAGKDAERVGHGERRRRGPGFGLEERDQLGLVGSDLGAVLDGEDAPGRIAVERSRFGVELVRDPVVVVVQHLQDECHRLRERVRALLTMIAFARGDARETTCVFGSASCTRQDSFLSP